MLYVKRIYDLYDLVKIAPTGIHFETAVTEPNRR